MSGSSNEYECGLQDGLASGRKEMMQAVDEARQDRKEIAKLQARVKELEGALADFKATAAKEIIFNGAGCSAAYLAAEHRAASALKGEG